MLPHCCGTAEVHRTFGLTEYENLVVNCAFQGVLPLLEICETAPGLTRGTRVVRRVLRVLREACLILLVLNKVQCARGRSQLTRLTCFIFLRHVRVLRVVCRALTWCSR